MTRVAVLRSFVASVTLLLCAPSSGSAQSPRDNLAAAIETVERSCSDDIASFCAKVTPGEGRLLLCMQAHEDQLSRRCQFSLYRASRGLENAVNRVAQTAEACWADIEARCGDAEKVGPCLMQNRATLSNACQTTIQAFKKAVQGVVGLRGMAVYSSDDRNVGYITDVKRGLDNKVQSIAVEVGKAIGRDSKIVEVNEDKIEELAERIKLRLLEGQVQSLPETRH